MSAKRRKQATKERAKRLAKAPDGFIASGDRVLTPGTREYERAIKSIAANLSDDELRDLISSSKGEPRA